MGGCVLYDLMCLDPKMMMLGYARIGAIVSPEIGGEMVDK
jgi:hypothetical protein